jgi:AraC-like DNA-binding protein
MFEGYAAAMIHRIGAEATFVDRVREVLSEALLHGTAGEEAVAREMGVTRRSLRRHLAESGLTFRRIREGLQRARAESMLREARLPIAEISYLLGYADASTFHRAFRRWTGSTPGDWRERHCGAPDHGGERDSGPESGGQTRHR